MALQAQYEATYQLFLDELSSYVEKLKAQNSETPSFTHKKVLLRLEATLNALKNVDITQYTKTEEERLDLLKFKIAIMDDLLKLWTNKRHLLKNWEYLYPKENEESAIFWNRTFPPYALATVFDAAFIGGIIALAVLIDPVFLLFFIGAPLLMFPFIIASEIVNRSPSRDSAIEAIKTSVKIENQKHEIAHTVNNLKTELKTHEARSMFFSPPTSRLTLEPIEPSAPVIATEVKRV